MTTIQSRARLLTIVALLLVTSASTAYTGGPLMICTGAPGTPVVWGSVVGFPVPYFTDASAPFSPFLSVADADALTAIGFGEWSGVPSSLFSAALAGTHVANGHPADITLANVLASVLSGVGPSTGFPGAGGFEVIYDDTGAILASIFGAPPGVLGIAGPEWTFGSPTCEIYESFAVMNLSTVDPGDTTPFPGAVYAGVFTHEFGHAINLAHTQTVGNVLLFGDGPEPGICTTAGYGSPVAADMETMYPFIDVSLPSTTGMDQATVDHPDDIASISNLYPTGGWPATVGTITGTVFDTDGVTPLGGVNVVARNTSDPFGDAVSALSGDFTQTPGDGTYTLNGLTIDDMYTVHVEGIVMGGFSQTPVVVADEEYWNGASESNIGLGPSADLVCSFTTITASATMAPKAGAAAVADIMLNDPLLPVDLVAFDAVADGNTVLLTWQTASETNNAGFEIQHRHLDSDFEPIDFVEGTGTTLAQQAYSYRATGLEPGWHLFRLKQIDFDGTFEHHPQVEVFVELLGTYALSAVHPNPFNPETAFTLMVASAQHVTVEVYDMAGRRVALLHDGLLNADERHRFVFEAHRLPSGLYFARIVGRTFTTSRSAVLMK